jgi:6-phosphogluconolactonase (cycloisomerase 2 family)
MSFVVGCAGFWDAPTNSGSSSFTLSAGSNISVAPGATSGNTSTITVTPASSFTGTVTLACAITSTPTGATSPATCSLSPTSVTFTSATAQTSVLTASTTSSTTTGTYNIKVTGISGNATQAATLCAQITTNSSTCTASSGNNSGAFYVLNQATTQIAAFTISSGSLARVSGSPYSLAYAPLSIAIDPKGNFLYVGTATGILLYSISSNGQLTLANNSNVISQDIATTMQVDPTGQWLLEAGPNLKELLGIRINSATGLPLSSTEQFALLPAATVQQIAVSSDSRQVFVVLGSSGTQNIAFASGSTGSPFGSSLNIPTITSGGAALSVAVDPTNRLIYVGETAARSGISNTGGMRVFNYQTLEELSGSPFVTGGLSPVAILPLPNGTNKGNYVYVANRNVSGSTTGLIQGFVVSASGSSYSVAAMSNTAAGGTATAGMAQDSLGNYLLVVNSGGNPDLQAFTFDATTAGKLDSAFTSATGTDPVQASAIAAVP